MAQLKRVKASRDAARVQCTLEAIVGVAPDYLPAHIGARRPLMPPIIDAVRARASVGEIADALERVWGRHQPAA